MYSNKAVRLLTLSSVSVPGSVMTMLTMSSVFVSRCYDAADPVVCLFSCLCVMMLLTMSSVCFSCLGLCYDAAAPVVCLFLCLGLCYDASPATVCLFLRLGPC